MILYYSITYILIQYICCFGVTKRVSWRLLLKVIMKVIIKVIRKYLKVIWSKARHTELLIILSIYVESTSRAKGYLSELITSYFVKLLMVEPTKHNKRFLIKKKRTPLLQNFWVYFYNKSRYQRHRLLIFQSFANERVTDIGYGTNSMFLRIWLQHYRNVLCFQPPTYILFWLEF